MTLLRKFGAGRILQFLGLVTILAGIGTGAATISDLEKINAINSGGVTTQAAFLDKAFFEGRRGTFDNYIVHVEFVTEDSTTITTALNTDQEQWEALPNDTPLMVRYLPDDPEYAFFEDRVPKLFDRLDAILTMLVVGFALLLGGPFIGRFIER
jgi:hypothetical protein